MNFRKYFFEIILPSYFQKFNLSKISHYTVFHDFYIQPKFLSAVSDLNTMIKVKLLQIQATGQTVNKEQLKIVVQHLFMCLASLLSVLNLNVLLNIATNNDAIIANL